MAGLTFGSVVGWLLVLVLVVIWYYAYVQYDDVLKVADQNRSEVFMGLSAYVLLLVASLAGLIAGVKIENPLAKSADQQSP